MLHKIIKKGNTTIIDEGILYILWGIQDQIKIENKMIFMIVKL